MTAAALDIEVFKGPTRRYRSVLRRGDGVEIELDGGAYNTIGGAAREVPHDIAHLVVEDELGLERGVWGVLAAGGLFRGATVRAGRRPPHAERRAREVLDGAVEQLNQAEILTRAVCDLSVRGAADPRALRAATGERWWLSTVTATTLERAFARLHDAGEGWSRLDAGGSLRFAWSRPPAAPRPRRRR
jgi:hypothetical protein